MILGGFLRQEKESSFVNVIKIFQKNPFTARPIKIKKEFLGVICSFFENIQNHAFALVNLDLISI